MWAACGAWMFAQVMVAQTRPRSALSRTVASPRPSGSPLGRSRVSRVVPAAGAGGAGLGGGDEQAAGERGDRGTR